MTYRSSCRSCASIERCSHFVAGARGAGLLRAHEGSGLSSRRPGMDYFKDGHLLKLLYVALSVIHDELCVQMKVVSKPSNDIRNEPFSPEKEMGCLTLSPRVLNENPVVYMPRIPAIC